jgi:hypothetical protein
MIIVFYYENNFFMLQFMIEARDSRMYFTKTATARMTINVVRNVAPRFNNLPDDITISENRATDEVIFTVIGVDQDLLRDVSFISSIFIIKNLSLALQIIFCCAFKNLLIIFITDFCCI